MADDRILAGQRKITAQVDGHFGSNGFTSIADTKIYHAADGTDDGSNTYDGAEIGHYYAIKCMVAATFGASNTSGAGDAITSGHVLAAGDVLYGKFTAVHLSAGTVYAYRARSKG
jgi:hypothetical protein